MFQVYIKNMETKVIELRLPEIGFNMPIADAIIALELLRYKKLSGTTPELIFRQLKHIFHMLESIGSAHIEGNNTTVADYVESTKIEQKEKSLFDNKEDIIQIQNGELAMKYIEENIDEININKFFLRELHAITVKDLSPNKEGALHPGHFRVGNVSISKSTHIPPDFTQVEPLIDELLEFINRDDPAKYDLLKIAIAHHRFVWIHPFENGNGRVVRLFTYALLLKKSIFMRNERIINPTAVFCSNRNEYYYHLAQADSGTDEGLIAWSEYMLRGLKNEIEKIDKLLDYEYLCSTILQPALKDALERAYITEPEYTILKVAFDKKEFQASDIKDVLGKNSSDISRMLRGLKERGMIIPIYETARRYSPAFSNGLLLRSILKMLDANNFLPSN